MNQALTYPIGRREGVIVFTSKSHCKYGFTKTGRGLVFVTKNHHKYGFLQADPERRSTICDKKQSQKALQPPASYDKTAAQISLAGRCFCPAGKL